MILVLCDQDTKNYGVQITHHRLECVEKFSLYILFKFFIKKLDA